MDLSVTQRHNTLHPTTTRNVFMETTMDHMGIRKNHDMDQLKSHSSMSTRIPSGLPSVKSEQPYYVNEVLLLMTGDQFDSWRQVGKAQKLTSDLEIAVFLIEHYQKTETKSDPAATCARCQTPLSTICPECSLSTSSVASLDTKRFKESDEIQRNPTVSGHDVTPSRAASPLDSSALENEENEDSFLDDVYQATTKAVIAVDTSLLTNSSCDNPEPHSEDVSPKKDEKKSPTVNIKINVKRKAGRPRKNTTRVNIKPCWVKLPTFPALQQHQDELKDGLVQTTQGQKSKTHQCRQCNAVFDSSTKLREHHNVHSKRKPHQCEHCPASFSSRNNLIAHVRKHTGERPYKCEQCGKAFARNTTLIQHMRIHTNERPFKCDQCDEAFKQRGQLIIHKRKHTGEKPFKCTECGVAFIAMGRLTAHMASHSGLRPYLCEECGASFTQKGILKAHIQTHTGEKPFSCDECGKRFYRNNDLRAHQRTHTGVRDIVCMVCGQAFLAASNFRRHMQKHTGYRPHLCNECGKYFASKSELKVHTRIHTGDKPYICQECGRGFVTRGNMMKHFNNRHKPKVVPPASAVSDLKTVDTIKKLFHCRTQDSSQE